MSDKDYLYKNPLFVENPYLWNAAAVIYWLNRPDKTGVVSEKLEDFNDLDHDIQKEYIQRVRLLIDGINHADVYKRANPAVGNGYLGAIYVH